MELFEKTISSKSVFEGKILKLRVDEVLLPNGNFSKREVVSHNGGCCIVPITEKNEIIMVQQFRYPYNEIIYELPAGKIDLGEDKLQCAIRELKEETGCIAETIEFLGEIYPSPGYTNEKIFLFVAKNLMIGDLQLDSDEFLNVVSFSKEKVLSMVKNNEIKDAKSIIGILRIFLN